ncbi:hypothetical protein ACFL0J_08295 [Candidatus Neomarinimicrobiota bacterium]
MKRNLEYKLLKKLKDKFNIDLFKKVKPFHSEHIKQPITLKGKVNNIQYELQYPYVDPIDQKNDWIDLNVKYKKKKYWLQITTINFVKERLAHYKKWGENNNGSYFWAPNMIILKRIDNKHIEKTLIDLVDKGILDDFLDRK